MLPELTKTFTYQVSGNAGNITIEGTTDKKTVLGVAIQGGSAGDSKINCGSTTFLRNQSPDQPYLEMNYICQNNLVFNKSGSTTSQVVVNYIMGDRINPSDPTIIYSFSEGEIISSLFLFGIVLILLFDLIYRQFIGVRIREKL